MVRTLQNIDYEVKRENLYETVAEKLEDSILSGNTQVGERLPSEQALAESFGVSRNVMRESLKLLKERGLIDSRMGGGSYITKPESSDLVNVVNRIILMDNIDYEQVFQMRGILESAACSLAAVKCTQQQVARLEMMNRQLREAAGNQEKSMGIDVDFHVEIARLSGNPLLEMFVEVMAHPLRRGIAAGYNIDDGNRDAFMRHNNIIQALREHDPHKAHAAAMDHISHSLDNIRERERMRMQ